MDERVAVLDREIARHATENSVARRLMTVPGIGPVTAAALTALAPPAADLPARSRLRRLARADPAPALDGRQAEARRDIEDGRANSLRRLLIIGASAVALGCPPGRSGWLWIARMLARKPPMLVRVALANKMARIVWALLAKGGIYRAPDARALGARGREAVEAWEGRRRGMAQRSLRRDRENQLCDRRFKRVGLNWT